jgi:threonine dehydrogenase-like Zn-dependent dehydrogenase
LVVDEITLIGSRCGPFPAALGALAGRRVDVRPMIHARYPLPEAVAAMAHAQQPGVLKVLLAMSA